jgi:hypothetical protein
MSHKAFAVVAGISLMLPACPQHVSPARQLPVETGRPRGPKQPAEVAFGRPDDTGRWLRLREVRYEEGKVFGWRIRLPCRQPVEYLEVMTLPSPGELAIDPEEIRETTISADKKTITTRDYAACIGGWLEHTWSLTPEDPKGVWEISVAIDGYETQVFRPRFVD